MSHKTQTPYKITLLKVSLLFIGIISSLAITPLASVSAHHASECSDVYTPLSSFVVDGVNANRAFYIQAMNETGVPWEMLAAIHYRETNFSHTNPSNGQGIFQFYNGDGGPYPAGPVNDGEFVRQLTFMANRIQSDYVFRGSVPRERRQLQANEQNLVIVKDTLMSYNGRASVYATQAEHFGYDRNTQPYEGSPYVMNRFNCDRARMGIITQDGGSIDGTDTRYGTFTLFARLRGEDYWRSLWSAYSWQVVSQYAYTDQTKTSGASTKNLLPNSRIYVGFRARNTGTTTWTSSGSNPVGVGTETPRDRSSPFYDSTWLGTNRAARLIESSVAPGEIGTFEFWMKAPNQFGGFHEYFSLVAEGAGWFNYTGLYFDMSVSPPTYTWQPVDQYAYNDASKTVGRSTANMMPGERAYVGIKARNTGNVPWMKSGTNPVHLGTVRPTDRSSPFYDSTWLGTNRAATLIEDQVNPGQIGTFEFWMTASNAGGTVSSEYFTPVAEGYAWMNDPGVNFFSSIGVPQYTWQLISQYAYTDQTKTTGKGTTNLAPGDRIFVGFQARNTGNITWRNSGSNPVNVGMTQPVDRLSSYFDGSWLGQNRPARLVESSVAPGQIGTFEFWMKAPNNQHGISLEHFSLVSEGRAWFVDPQLNFYMSTQ